MGTPWQDSGGPCSGGPGKIRAPCMIRGASAAKRAPPWQDLRAVHSRKAVCGAFRIHGAHILPKPARFGCMAAICCQGGALFPSGAPSGMHEARKLPQPGAWERISRASRRRRTAESASRAYVAMAPASVERTTAKSCRRRTLGGGSSQGGFAKRLDAQGGFARRDPQERLARHGRSLGFARRLDAHNGFAGLARKAARRARRIRKAARRARHGCTPGLRGGSMRTSGSHAGLEGRLDEQSQQGTKKAPLRRAAPSPQTTGANQIRPES